MRVSVNPDTVSPHTEADDLVWILATVVGGDVYDIDAPDILGALREAAEEHREYYHRCMLESWTDEDTELPEDREGLEAAFRDEYNRRCEGPSHWPEHTPGLTSEDYEAIDYNGGWENGFGAAVEVVRKLAG